MTDRAGREPATTVPVGSRRSEEYAVGWRTEGGSPASRVFTELDVALAFYDHKRRQGVELLSWGERTTWATPWKAADPDAYSRGRPG